MASIYDHPEWVAKLWRVRRLDPVSLERLDVKQRSAFHGMDRSSEAALDEVEQPETILSGALHWLDGSGGRGGLLLAGPSGTGKTYLASALANEFLLRGYTVRVVSAPDMFTSLQPNGKRTLQDYVTPDLLVIDDLGTEKPSEFTNSTLCRILGGRFESRHRTIVTANLTSDELRVHIGERSWSRLAVSQWLILVGDDRRQMSFDTTRATFLDRAEISIRLRQRPELIEDIRACKEREGLPGWQSPDLTGDDAEAWRSLIDEQWGAQDAEFRRFWDRIRSVEQDYGSLARGLRDQVEQLAKQAGHQLPPGEQPGSRCRGQPQPTAAQFARLFAVIDQAEDDYRSLSESGIIRLRLTPRSRPG